MIFVLGLSLRLYHIDRFPERNRTADEYAWTWSGMTLLSEGTPRSWSWLPGYPSFSMMSWRNDQYRIVRPWLDHPPLYSIYVGAFMHLTGSHDPFSVELAHMRMSTMLLFIVSFFLFYAVAARVSDPAHALLALAFWAVAPAAVWNGRLVMAEQMMLPLALAGALAYLQYNEDGRRRWLVLLVVWCASLPLCKAAATAFVLWLFSLSVIRRQWRPAIASCAGGGLGLSIHALYGHHFGWQLFRTIMTVQAARFTNFGGFFALVFNQRVVEKAFMYLPFLLGFFVLMADLCAERAVEIGLFAAIYSACIAFFLPWNEYGWYLIPLYPALAFGLASFVLRAWREAAAGSAWVWLLFSITYLCWIACDGQIFTPARLRWVYLGLLVALPFSALVAKRAPSRWRAGFATLVALQMAGDIWYVVRK